MIQIEKPFLLRLYCYLQQAERSVHRPLCNHWSDFQQYYKPARAAAIESLLARLDQLIPQRRSSPPPDKAEVFRNVPEPGMFRVFFGRWLTRGKTSFPFTAEEIAFIALTLETLLHFLDQTEKPAMDTLVTLRMDFCQAGGNIDWRCYGLEELRRASFIEHFDRTEWYPHLQLWEILGEPPPDVASSPSTAKDAG